jgi:hypothetical protein
VIPVLADKVAAVYEVEQTLADALAPEEIHP